MAPNCITLLAIHDEKNNTLRQMDVRPSPTKADDEWNAMLVEEQRREIAYWNSLCSGSVDQMQVQLSSNLVACPFDNDSETTHAHESDYESDVAAGRPFDNDSKSPMPMRVTLAST